MYVLVVLAESQLKLHKKEGGSYRKIHVGVRLALGSCHHVAMSV